MRVFKKTKETGNELKEYVCDFCNKTLSTEIVGNTLPKGWYENIETETICCDDCMQDIEEINNYNKTN